MESTPPRSRSHSTRSKSKSLSRRDRSVDNDSSLSLSLDLTTMPSSPPPPPDVKPRSQKRSCALPLQELLLLSPCKPRPSSRSRLADRLDAADELARRARRRDGNYRQEETLCGSPRRERRSRRLLDVEGREEKGDEDFGNVRRRKRSGVHRKEKEKEKENRLSIVPVVNTSSSLSPSVDDDGEKGSLDRIGQAISDLVMWRDVAKSTLWFGFGCTSLLSSCFAKGINFSIFSAMCQIGLLFLGLAFFSNSLSQRRGGENKRDIKLKEEDIVRIARLLLPATNLVISKTKELFSGEPSMTLKVAPFQLMGAEYGQLITLRRLCAIGFLASFTIPKLFSCYVTRINQKVEFLKQRLSEKWNDCSHKKIVATLAIMAFWNLTSIKKRILTAFISIVMVRYYRQQSVMSFEIAVEAEKEEQLKALMISSNVSKE